MRPFIPALVVVAGACALAGLGSLDNVDPVINDQSQVPLVEAKIATMKARSEAVDEMLAGRLTFAETAERFRQLTAEDPSDCMRWLRMIYPDCSDDELYYRHVILYAETRLRQHHRDSAYLDELKNQLKEMRKRESPSDCWND
jgi:hypothetical protein